MAQFGTRLDLVVTAQNAELAAVRSEHRSFRIILVTTIVLAATLIALSLFVAPALGAG